MMRRWWLGLACWLALGLGPVPAQGQPGQLNVGAQDSYLLSPHFLFFEDKGGKLTLDDVLQPQVQAAFRPVPQSGPGANFGLTPSAIWLRIELEASAGAAADWLVELAYPPLDQMELYLAHAALGVQRQVGGDALPFADRAVPHRNHVLPIRLASDSTNTLYLRLQSQGTVSAPVRLWQPAALWKHDQATYAALALYFGLLGGLLMYNLLLFASVRDIAYLIYGGFAAFMAIGQAALTGLGVQFLWPQWTWWNSVSPPVGLSAAAIFALLFTRSFLFSAMRMRSIDRLLLLQLAGWALALLAALGLPYAVSTWMVTILAVVSVVTMMAVGVYCVRREYAGARYFFTAWALLMLGVVTLALHNAGVLPSNAITANALLIGSALEMVLLSFALAHRINVARRFKEQAQARIAAEHAMVQALSQSQERLRTVLEEREIILESSIVGIAFLTPQGRFYWANRAMLDIFGFEGRPSQSMEPFYVSREQYLRIGGEVAECVGRGEVYETELQMRRVDGTLIWVSLSGKAVSRRDLSQGTVWVIMNISHRKQLEEQLQKTNSEREAILNSALVGIVLSVAGRHEWVNEKFAQMLGYPRQVLIGQPADHLHPDDESWQRFGAESRASLVESGSYICERQLKRRNGELFWVEMGGSCIRPKDPASGVIWTFLDITGRKKSESEVHQALQQQKTLNELRSRFVAMTSHEFRTPLAAILSAEELLRHYGDRLPQAERIEVLDGIAAGVQRMSRMIDRVLLLGKADAGMLDFEPQRLQLAPLCRQFVQEAHAQQPGDRSEVALEVGEEVGEGAYDGGRVRFKVRRDSGSTVFEVADQGVGIPTDEIPHLFEPFHRASNVGMIQGTGLGLAIVKSAVEMHGGSIEVQSAAGQGTAFTVCLPDRSCS